MKKAAEIIIMELAFLTMGAMLMYALWSSL